MLMLTTFKNEKFAVNPDLIEEIRAVGSGSSIGLITGRTYSASESIETVCQALIDYRSKILSTVIEASPDTPTGPNELSGGQPTPTSDKES